MAASANIREATKKENIDFRNYLVSDHVIQICFFFFFAANICLNLKLHLHSLQKLNINNDYCRL